jgi:outer membrane protein assembly factor BamE (lipoprotein component of BamABCDE complex)
VKKWIAYSSLAGLVFSLSGCTTAVMTYVRTQRIHHGYIIERTRDQVRACLGQPKSISHVDGKEVWKYNYRTSSHQVCKADIYFKGKVVKDTKFTDISIRGPKGQSACEKAKIEFRPCFKRYLMVTK